MSWYQTHITSLTFELDLQHCIGVLGDVTIGPESVTGAMHADLQSKVVLCGENTESTRIFFFVFRLLLFPGTVTLHSPSEENLIKCEEEK